MKRTDEIRDTMRRYGGNMNAFCSDDIKYLLNRCGALENELRQGTMIVHGIESIEIRGRAPSDDKLLLIKGWRERVSTLLTEPDEPT